MNWKFLNVVIGGGFVLFLLGVLTVPVVMEIKNFLFPLVSSVLPSHVAPFVVAFLTVTSMVGVFGIVVAGCIVFYGDKKK